MYVYKTKIEFNPFNHPLISPKTRRKKEEENKKHPLGRRKENERERKQINNN